MMATHDLQTRLTAERLTNTTIIFLLAAPLVVVLYASFLFNPSNIDNTLLWIIQVIADSISMVVLMSLWLTILLDILVPEHHRIHSPGSKTFLEQKHPTIDVIVTTAGEPLTVIKQTLIAALNMYYPHTTNVFDDGSSDELKALCTTLGVNYVRRPKRQWAKAGNINYGLRHCTGEFFALLDADQVPHKNFIVKLLQHMEDKSMAMVQSPQYFSNTNFFIANGTAQAQEIFYKHVCPAKNISNSAFCVGTNVIFRRTAIDQIGGIALIGHSEDIWTSFELHERGWKTLFVNEILAHGKAPTSIVSFFRQQLRWAQGGLSMLFERNPLFSEKLSLDQRLQYFSANSFFLVGISICAYLFFPLIYLLFGLKALNTDSGLLWMIHYIQYFVLYYSLTWLLLGRIHVSTIATALASFYPYLLALFATLFGTTQTWVATSSSKNTEAILMRWIWPHVFVIVLTLGALVVGWFDPSNFWTTFYNSVWAIINMYLLFVFITGEKRLVTKEIRKVPDERII